MDEHDVVEAGTAIIAMCKEIKGINASADVGEYIGFKLNVTFDSFNNKFVMNVKGVMSHPMEVGSDAIGNITRINNVLEAMPSQLEEAQMKLSNVKHQLETAKAEVDKPFPQEAELAEKLERLAELNSLLNMDEKGDDAIGMDDEATEPEKPHEDVKSVDEKGDEVADIPIKQSNFAKVGLVPNRVSAAKDTLYLDLKLKTKEGYKNGYTYYATNYDLWSCDEIHDMIPSNKSQDSIYVTVRALSADGGQENKQ